jgi:hypothetical protein
MIVMHLSKGDCLQLISAPVKKVWSPDSIVCHSYKCCKV